MLCAMDCEFQNWRRTTQTSSVESHISSCSFITVELLGRSQKNRQPIVKMTTCRYLKHVPARASFRSIFEFQPHVVLQRSNNSLDEQDGVLCESPKSSEKQRVPEHSVDIIM
jgi:hypothetical protein